MGLKERQEIARITNEVVPGYNQRLQDKFGTSMVFDNEWSSFEDDLDAIYSVGGLMNMTANALEWVGRDDIGRQAIADRIERVVLVNVQSVDQKAITLENGALRLQSTLSGDDWDGRFSDNAIIEWLENNL